MASHWSFLKPALIQTVTIHPPCPPRAAQAQPNTNIVLLTTEVTTPAYYPGQDKHRLVTNMLFRMGAAAMLFSNRPSMARAAKYELEHCYRTHIGASDEAYRWGRSHSDCM